MTPENLNLLIYQGVTFGPQSIYLQEDNGTAMNVTGWAPIAKAACVPGGPVGFDLAPALGNASNGEVVLSHSNGNTSNFPAGGRGWDLLMQAPNGAIFGPYRQGRVVVSPVHTQTV